MKELSIEQKAKRYDEALERAKDYHKQLLDEDNPEWAGEIENIFPELAESEDERIKGAIIDHLKDNNLIEWAAWLEKQGKPKWSEEDEENLRDIISAIHYIPYQTAEAEIERTDWLKSLKQRIEQGQVNESAIFEHEKRTCKENDNSLTCDAFDEQPSEEDVVGIGELGKVWDEKQDPILQRLDRIYDLLLHKLNEKIIINNPFPRLTETPYKPGEVWCGSSAATSEGGGEE